MKTLKQSALAFVLLLASTLTLAQTQSACFPPAQSPTGPVSITLWCQIVDYSSTAPLAVGIDTGFITLQRGFHPAYYHVQYDNWYSAMNFVYQFEFVGPNFDIFTFPSNIPYDGVNLYTDDIPIGVVMQPGQLIRIHGVASIPHTCNLIDNCGMHVVFTFQ